MVNMLSQVWYRVYAFVKNKAILTYHKLNPSRILCSVRNRKLNNNIKGNFYIDGVFKFVFEAMILK